MWFAQTQLDSQLSCCNTAKDFVLMYGWPGGGLLAIFMQLQLVITNFCGCLQNPNVTDIWVSGPVEAESGSLSAYLNATAE